VVVVGVCLPPLTALGVRTALVAASQPFDVEVVESRDELLGLVGGREPGLAIVDPYRPDLSDGLRFCQQLKELPRPPGVLAFCDVRDRTDLMYCMLAGIDSAVSTQQPPGRLVDAVRSTLEGGREWMLGATMGRPDGTAKGLAELTSRELEVLWMVRERYNNKQIATLLSISPNTVKNHVAAIQRKLNTRHRSDLYAGLPISRNGVPPDVHEHVGQRARRVQAADRDRPDLPGGQRQAVEERVERVDVPRVQFGVLANGADGGLRDTRRDQPVGQPR
jgi:DNA-binding NarL/FixJ family response regulator